MLTAGRHLYVIFMCHLALEKALKAHVALVTGGVPPRTHDLIYLLRAARLDMPDAHLEWVGKINNVSVPVRYPDSLEQALQDWPESAAREYLRHTEEVVRWLVQHRNLSR